MKHRGTSWERGECGIQALMEHPPTPSQPGTASPRNVRLIATFKRPQPSEIDPFRNSKTRGY